MNHQDRFTAEMLTCAVEYDAPMAEWLEADYDVHSLLSETLKQAVEDQDWVRVAAVALKLAELDQDE